jgi:hypothetical protein
MAVFTINKDQISRLKVFNDYCKKLENISPIEEDQSFIIKGDKLYIYGKGAQAAQIDIVVDISKTRVDKNDALGFGMSVSNFVKFLEKTKDDEISVKIKDQQITITGTKTTSVFKQTLIWNKSAQEIQELETFIDDILKEPEFKKPISIKLEGAYKGVITDLTAMTKLLEINQAIELNKDFIRFADSLNILRLTIPKDAISSENEVLFHRDLTNLCKNIEAFTISEDKKWFYFDVKEYGIKMLFIPKASEWQFPDETDIDAIVPIDPKIVVKISVEDFYKAIDDVDDIFESESWQYKQLKFKTPVDFVNEKKIVLHYDNMKYEVSTELPVTIIEQKDTSENFEFVIPAIYFKYLKSILETEDTFDIIYSSKDKTEPNGIGIIVKNKDLRIVLAKMS